MNKTNCFYFLCSQSLYQAVGSVTGTWSIEKTFSGEDVRCFAVDPHNPNRIYAGTHGSGVFCTVNGGRSWHAAGLDGKIVKSLAVSPHEPGTVYAGLKPAAIYVSREAGRRWEELAGFRQVRGRWWWRSPAEPPDWRAYVMGLAVSPTDPEHLAAGVEFGALVISHDGGQSWSNHKKGALRDCHRLKFHAYDGSWIYEGGGGGAAFSKDGGQSWRQERGMPDRYGWACAADPERPEIWYFSAGPMPGLFPPVPIVHVDGRATAKIYRSAGGAQPERLAGGLPQPLDHLPYDLATDPNAPGHVYAGLSNGDIWFSSDYGDGWRKLSLKLPAGLKFMTLLSQ